VESYTLFLGALLLTGGSLGDLFGQRRVFGCGVALFAAASIYCGFAPDILHLIIARSLQGVGGALLVPSSLALLSVTFSRKELGKAIGTWSGVTSITSAAGPMLGGVLAQHASWRWVFFINVPIALAVGAIVLWRMPAVASKTEHVKIDWLGSVLATLGLGGIVFGFLQSSVAIGLCGAFGLLLFVVAEWREKSPMLPLRIFRSTDFTGTGILTFLLYGALSGALFFLPLNLVQIQGYSETAAGAALLPVIFLIATLSRWSATLLDRFSARVLLFWGPVITAGGFALLAFPGVGGFYWAGFFPAALVLGFGMAITVAPLTTTVMSSVEENRSGIASGVNNALSRVAGLISIAVFGLVLSVTYSGSLRSALDRQGTSSSRRQEITQMAPGLAAGKVSGKEKDAVSESFVTGFRVVMWLSAGLAAAGAVSSILLIGKPSKSGKRRK
jgi:EmrB/QacA subfamily drug resistance transporter